MKVLHFNTLYDKGGAAKQMRILSERLEAQYDVQHNYIIGRTSFSNLNDKGIISLDKEEKYCFGQRKLKRILEEHGLQYLYLPSESNILIRNAKIFNPDIIHLHNTHGNFFQTNLIKNLANIAPIIWTFHDMFNFTGHCAHSFDCEKWKTGCGRCPYLETYPKVQKDKTRFLWWYKKNIYKSVDFKIVVPSHWLKKIVAQSFLKEKDIYVIHNGIRTDIFRKTDKLKSREKLSLPKEKKIILFSAHGGVNNSFKGGRFVSEIYEKLKNRNDIFFINIGGEEKRTDGNWLDYGFVESEQKMALLYSSADLMIYPTLADNCPLAVIESISCGLPVVTFDVGGVPEIVEHEKTGYIAKYKDSNDLLRGVNMLLDDEILRKNFGEAGEKRAREMFDAKIMAEKYYELYCETLGRS